MANPEFFAKALALQGLNRPGGFNNLALGNKIYGGGRPMPNIGSVSAEGRKGYAARDQRTGAKKQALLEFMKGRQAGNFGGAAVLRGQR